jgi:hypothetical protein
LRARAPSGREKFREVPKKSWYEWSVEMKKLILSGLMILLVLSGGRAVLAKEPGPASAIEHKKTDVVFIGYKTTVKVNATPAEVEKYALDIQNLSIKTRGHTMAISSSRPMAKLGDRADFREVIYGMPYPGKFVLVYLKPGEEVWYLSLLGPDQISLLRLEARPIQGGTKVTIKYELQRSKTLKYQLTRVVDIQSVMAKLIDNEIVKLQSHFDPSVKPGELLGKDKLGEFYNAFYQGEQVSVKINAGKDKVAQYLTRPQTWQAWKNQYGHDLGACMSDGKPGQCPVSVRIAGQDIKADSFAGEFKPGAYSAAYWVTKPVVAGIGAALKPVSGGTKLTVQYMIDAPYESATQQSDLMMTILQVPQVLEQFLLDIKKECEKGN